MPTLEADGVWRQKRTRCLTNQDATVSELPQDLDATRKRISVCADHHARIRRTGTRIDGRHEDVVGHDGWIWNVSIGACPESWPQAALEQGLLDFVA
jgi:hypothetical protein